jgi:hypothetical protein
VARTLLTAGVLAVAGGAVAPDARAVQFESRPTLAPTTVRVTTQSPAVAPGLVFTTPKGGGAQNGAQVFDSSGALVWFRPARPGTSILDLKPQLYQGRPVATFWEGRALRGYGFGAFKIVDQDLHEIGSVSPKGRNELDFHEFTITPQGTALAISYKPVRGDTRGVKGGAKNDLVMRNTIEEIDIRTNEVLWSWDATKAISPKESYLAAPTRPEVAYDTVHANSVNLDSDGDLLVSARHTHAIYKVDKETKRIIWKLGGKDSSFRLGRGARFAWQHDAHRRPDGTISLFDNASSLANDPRNRSKGLQLRVDERARTASVVRQFVNPVRKVDNTQGNLQALPNGNWFVGWGGTGDNVSEFSPDGTQIFEARYASPRTESYRAYRAPWVAQPTVPPAVVARRDGQGTAVRASWNGATTVAAWRVLGGSSASTLVPRRQVGRQGFETLLRYGTADRVVRVQALDAAGSVLATSKAVAPGTRY